LGEAFGERLQSEITRLSDEGENEVVVGLKRRQNHLRVISQIVEVLFQSSEEDRDEDVS
jgi:diphthamide synthase subunit DPH2